MRRKELSEANDTIFTVQETNRARPSTSCFGVTREEVLRWRSFARRMQRIAIGGHERLLRVVMSPAMPRFVSSAERTRSGRRSRIVRAPEPENRGVPYSPKSTNTTSFSMMTLWTASGSEQGGEVGMPVFTSKLPAWNGQTI